MTTPVTAATAKGSDRHHSDKPAMLLLATPLRPWALRRKPRHPWDNEGGIPDHRAPSGSLTTPSDVVGRRRVIAPTRAPEQINLQRVLDRKDHHYDHG
jgi:hypothetical protein